MTPLISGKYPKHMIKKQELRSQILTAQKVDILAN